MSETSAMQADHTSGEREERDALSNRPSHALRSSSDRRSGVSANSAQSVWRSLGVSLSERTNLSMRLSRSNYIAPAAPKRVAFPRKGRGR